MKWYIPNAQTFFSDQQHPAAAIVDLLLLVMWHNVNGDERDQYNRYRMPAIVTKHEGTRTVFVNYSAIVKALDQPPVYLRRFLSHRLGAQITVDRDGRFIISGRHAVDRLQNALNDYIQKFVLCERCSCPETNLTTSKKQITKSCRACGGISKLSQK